jgi:predicted ATPase
MARPRSVVSLCSATLCNLSLHDNVKRASKTLRRHLLVLLVLPWLFVQPSLAQVATGTPPFGSFGGGPFDVVNLGI